MTVVIGVDSSLTGTGICVIGDGLPRCYTITSKPTKNPTIADRIDRISKIADQTFDDIKNLLEYRDYLVVIEQPAYGSRMGSQHDRSGLWWELVKMFYQCGGTVVEVTPKGRARYCTGKGNADKQQVLEAARRLYPEVEIKNDNEADATVLAAIGRRYLGEAIETVDLSPEQQDTYDKIRKTWDS